MEDAPRRNQRIGRIDGEPLPFVSSALDPDSGHVHITVVQRGSRTVERLRTVMTRDTVEVQMPGETEPFTAVPRGIDVTATPVGGATIYRVDLTLERATPAAGGVAPAVDAGIAERIARIEAKLDRILALLERDTRTPGA